MLDACATAGSIERSASFRGVQQVGRDAVVRVGVVVETPRSRLQIRISDVLPHTIPHLPELLGYSCGAAVWTVEYAVDDARGALLLGRRARRDRRATVCYMRTVSHREMRNNSGEILRAVAAGETVQVTNNGRVAALIVPPPIDPLDELIERGRARAPLVSPTGFASIERVSSELSSAQILDDLRNPW